MSDTPEDDTPEQVDPTAEVFEREEQRAAEAAEADEEAPDDE
jgi:hypothetical protein